MIGNEHRVAIVGAGLMGRRHAEAFDAVRNVQIAAVCDLSLDAAQGLAAAYDATAVTGIRRLLEDDSIDIIVVATGDRQHVEAASAAILAGKNVLVEKPIASSVGEARQIASLAADAEGIVAVGHQLRFDPRFAGAADAVRSGSLGPLVHASFRRNSSIAGPRRYGASTTLPWHVLVHDVDLLRFITGFEVENIYARGSKVSDTETSLDSMLAVAELSDGSIASFEASWVLPEAVGASLDAVANIVCVGGSAMVTSAEQGLSVIDMDGRRYPDTVRYFSIAGHTGGLLQAQAQGLIGAIDGLRPAPCSAFDGLQAVRVVEAAERSLLSGRPEQPAQ